MSESYFSMYFLAQFYAQNIHNLKSFLGGIHEMCYYFLTELRGNQFFKDKEFPSFSLLGEIFIFPKLNQQQD